MVLKEGFYFSKQMCTMKPSEDRFDEHAASDKMIKISDRKKELCPASIFSLQSSAVSVCA